MDAKTSVMQQWTEGKIVSFGYFTDLGRKQDFPEGNEWFKEEDTALKIYQLYDHSSIWDNPGGTW